MCDEQVKQRVQSEHGNLKYRVDQAEKSLESLRDTVHKFNEASGLYIHAGMEDIPEMGDAVRRVMSGDKVFEKFKSELGWTLRTAQHIVDEIKKQIEQIPDTGSGVESEQRKTSA